MRSVAWAGREELLHLADGVCSRSWLLMRHNARMLAAAGCRERGPAVGDAIGRGRAGIVRGRPVLSRASAG